MLKKTISCVAIGISLIFLMYSLPTASAAQARTEASAPFKAASFKSAVTAEGQAKGVGVREALGQDVHADPKDQSKALNVAGELIVSYSVDGALNEARGTDILVEHALVAQAIEGVVGVKVKAFRAASPVFVKKMQESSRTERQVYAEIISKRKSAGKKVSFEDPSGASPNFARMLVLNFSDLKMDIKKAAAQLKGARLSIGTKTGKIEIAEPNNIFFTNNFVPADPQYSLQWAHPKTQADQGWNIGRGDPAIKIAVIDTGVATTHEDLQDRIALPINTNDPTDFVNIDTSGWSASGFTTVPGEDYTDVDTDPIDFNGHGTHCAGIIAASANTLGVIGVAHLCKILPLRAGYSIMYQNKQYGCLDNAGILAAMDAAMNVDYGADVVSMSFCGTYSALQELKVQAMYNLGIVLVGAAGNVPTESMSESYPAAFPQVIAVAATGKNDVLSSYSTRGYWISVCAPGGDSAAGQPTILSTVPKTTGGENTDPTGYKFLEGTSMATPYVAGLAGLMLSKNAALLPAQVRSIIMSQADNIDTQNPVNIGKIGAGRVNVFKTMTAVQASLPVLAINKVTGIDSTNNAQFNVNDTIKLQIALKNTAFNGSGITGVLSTTATNIVIDQARKSYSYGAMNYGDIKSNSADTYWFKVTGAVAGQIPLTLTLTGSNNYSQVINFTIDNSIFYMGDIFVSSVTGLYPTCGHAKPQWGDYDNDGLLDLVLVGWDGVSNINTTKIYHNNGLQSDGTWSFTENTTPTPAGEPSLPQLDHNEVAWGDYDNDGYLDLLLSGDVILPTGGISAITNLYHNNHNGTFSLNTGANFPGNNYGSVAWGDFDNDGWLDLIMTGGMGLYLYRNNHNGTFQDKTSTSGIYPWAGNAVWGDYDNDGWLDLIVIGRSTTKLYHNNGNGTFSQNPLTTNVFQDFLEWRQVAVWGDYNNDGLLDILMTGNINNTTSVTKLYKNLGAGQFQEILSTGLPAPFYFSGLGALAWGDYDNDGFLDILIGGNLSNTNSGEGYIKVFHNSNGSGTFVENMTTNTISILDAAAVWGDFNNDGHLDFFVSMFGNSRIYKNVLPSNPNTPPNPPPLVTSTTTSGTNNTMDVTLTWAKAMDAQTPQNGLYYNIAIGTTGLNSINIVSPMASMPDGWRRIPAIRGQNENTSWIIKGLPNGNYYCGVQAIDSGLMGSAFTPCSFGNSTTFAISGTVCTGTGLSCTGGTPVAGALVSGPGLTPQTTGVDGKYSFNVPSGWGGGMVLASHPDHSVFVPQFGHNYNGPLNNNQIGKDYVAPPTTPLTAQITASANPVCGGASVTYSVATNATGATYQWYKNAALVTGATAATYAYTPVNGDQIYCIVSTTSTAFSGSPKTSNTIMAVVDPNVMVSVSIAATPGTTVNAGTNVSFVATTVNPGSNPTYEWKVGSTVQSNFTGPTINYMPVNNDVVTCKLTSNVACPTGNPATSSLTMTVQPALTVSIAASATPVCGGSSTTYTATPVNATGSVTYQWKKNGTTNIGITNPLIYTAAAGEVITCTVSANGVTATSNSITVAATNAVSVSIAATPGTTVSAGTSVSFVATPVNPGTNPNYEWKVNGVIQSGTLATFSYTPANGDVVTCKLASNVACPTGNPATSSVTMTVRPALTVSIAASATPVCGGSSTTYTATPVNAIGSVTYQWKKNGTTNIGITNPLTYTAAAGEVITCTVSANGVTATSNSITAAATNAVSVSIAASENPAYANNQVTFTATPVNAGSAPSYVWKVNGIIQPGTSATFIYTPVNGDVVTCRLTSNVECPTGNPADSNTVTMTVNPRLPVSVSIAASENPVCDGTSVTYKAMPTHGGSNPGYQWYIGTTLQTTSTTDIFTTTPVNGASVTCVLTSSLPSTMTTGSPATSDPILMAVNPQLPVSVSITASTTSVNAGTSVTFTATPVNEGTSPSYQWQVNGNNAGTDNPEFTYTPANGDIVTCLLTSSAVCALGSPALSNAVTMTVFEGVVIKGYIWGPQVMSGVTISVTDESGNPFSPDISTMTDADGKYVVKVLPEFLKKTLIVTPSKSGYVFRGTAPENMGQHQGIYKDVVASIYSQDYEAKQYASRSFLIKGMITLKKTDHPLNDVKLVLKGELSNGQAWPANGSAVFITQYDGLYQFEVPEGWRGRITASKPGYNMLFQVPGPFFGLSYADYRNVIADQLLQNYLSEDGIISNPTITISGKVGTSATAMLSGVEFKAAGSDGITLYTTTSSGTYTFTKNRGWSGTVTPTKTGFAFKPISVTYNSSQTQTNVIQNYAAIVAKSADGIIGKESQVKK